MSDHKGQIVRATAGRDKEGIFCVMGVEKETGRLLLADGKRRRAARSAGGRPIPRRKSRGMCSPSRDLTASFHTPPSKS